MASFESDMMDFILNDLSDGKSDDIYYSPNNITAVYIIMSKFKEKIEKHPFIFNMFFRV